jgi:flagellar biosynthetic protein FliR
MFANELPIMPVPDFLMILFISVRVATVFFMTPIFYGSVLPSTVRILLVIGLSVALAAGQAPLHSMSVLGDAPGLPAIILAIISEFLLGSIMALSILIAFSAFSIAGGLLDVQIGFGMAQIFDPVSRRQASVLTTLFNQAAVVVFFLINGHHALLRGLVYSLERFPPGNSWSVNAMFPAVLKSAAGLLGLGFSLAAPVIFCLFLAEVALAVISRNLPQMNMFVISLPMKVVIGLVALAIWQGGIGAAMSRVYGSIYSGWTDLFTSARGTGIYG